MKDWLAALPALVATAFIVYVVLAVATISIQWLVIHAGFVPTTVFVVGVAVGGILLNERKTR